MANGSNLGSTQCSGAKIAQHQVKGGKAPPSIFVIKNYLRIFNANYPHLELQYTKFGVLLKTGS